MQVRLQKLAAAVVDFEVLAASARLEDLEDPLGQRDQQVQGDRRNRP